MATIESRAHVLSLDVENNMKSAYTALVKIATEQDRIARQEERKRCIQMAQETTCFFCECRICPQMRMSDCEKWKKIRKAIEEGGET